MPKIDAPSSLYSGDRFLTYTQIIATFEDIDSEQELFMSEAYHDKKATPQEIEQSICERAVEYLICSKPYLVNKLVKISCCIVDFQGTNGSAYKPEEEEKIKLFGAVSLGKFYFQPDQLCDVSHTIRTHYPEVACDVISNYEFQRRHKDQ
tara:strand:- start:1174 stop:1623 length:450 start_codon:yes stop_codon:yes gene_type:complete